MKCEKRNSKILFIASQPASQSVLFKHTHKLYFRCLYLLKRVLLSVSISVFLIFSLLPFYLSCFPSLFYFSFLYSISTPTVHTAPPLFFFPLLFSILKSPHYFFLYLFNLGHTTRTHIHEHTPFHTYLYLFPFVFCVLLGPVAVAVAVSPVK